MTLSHVTAPPSQVPNARVRHVLRAKHCSEKAGVVKRCCNDVLKNNVSCVRESEGKKITQVPNPEQMPLHVTGGNEHIPRYHGNSTLTSGVENV